MKKEEVNKPITLIRAELISSLTDSINNSSLPAFVIEPILKDLYTEISRLAQKQFEEDRKSYISALKKMSSNNDKSED